MKLITLILLLSFSISCIHRTTNSIHHPNDTLKTIGIFINNDSKRVMDYVYQVSFDSLIVDTSTLQASYYRDTIYFIPFLIPQLDSLGKQKKDSTGHLLFGFQYMQTNKNRIIWSANTNIDSILKK